MFDTTGSHGSMVLGAVWASIVYYCCRNHTLFWTGVDPPGHFRGPNRTMFDQMDCYDYVECGYGIEQTL